VAVAALLGAWPALAAPRLGGLLGALGALAVLLAAVAQAAALGPLVAGSLALLGAEYAALLQLRGDSLDGRAPLEAAGLLLAGELGYWALELRVASEPRGVPLARVAQALALAVGAGVVAALLLLVATVPPSGGLAWDALGVAAAAAALALAVATIRRPG
jgi:hypothetical protein